jgi:hypothetical protein
LDGAQGGDFDHKGTFIVRIVWFVATTLYPRFSARNKGAPLQSGYSAMIAKLSSAAGSLVDVIQPQTEQIYGHIP